MGLTRPDLFSVLAGVPLKSASRFSESEADAIVEIIEARLGLKGPTQPLVPADPIKVGLCVIDKDLRFVQINEVLAQINGRTAEAHIGKHIAEVLPGAAEGVVPQLLHVLNTGEPIVGGEVVTETPAHPGEERRYLHNYYPICGTDGAVSEVNCIVVGAA